MKNFISKRAQYSVTFFLLAPIAFGPASKVLGQTDRDANRAKAVAIKQSAGNGIHVDQPKVYDDTALQLMLQAARQRLAAL